MECGGTPPRVLVLDDYFMTEVEKVAKDPDTGRKVKTKVSANLSGSSSDENAQLNVIMFHSQPPTGLRI